MAAVAGAFGFVFGSAAWSQQPSTPGAAVLPSVAVSEIRVDPSARPSMPNTFSAYGLTREIESALDATRKFRVVSRSQNEANAFADEWTLTRRGNAGIERATYLISVEVLGLDVRTVTRDVPNMRGKQSSKTVGRMEMRVAILTTATRAVQSRFPIEASIETPAVTHDANSGPTAGAQALGFVDMAKEVGRRLADRLLDEVYPVQVIQRQGNIVFLNRGQDSGYEIGEKLRVFSAGSERLRDPYTGEDLGPLEVQLGEVRVTDMRPKVTMAEVISETTPIAQGSIVRKQVEK